MNEECDRLERELATAKERIKALERNRVWCADILEKELNCRCATITSVYHALKAEPLGKK